MNVKSFEKKEKNTAELEVEVSAEEFDTAINNAYKKNKHMISVPGFRKGKAPRKIIENMYGTSVFYEDALDEIYPKALQYAITEKEISMVGQPSLLDVNIGEDKAVVIKYGIALYPEVTMGEYKGIKAPRAEDVVTDEELDDEIERVRKRSARIQTAERPAAMNDTVNINYEGFLDGEPFEGGKDEGFNLVLGSHRFIPGFEDGIVGMSAGDEKDLNLKFPDDYSPDYAGKDVLFKVKVNEVKENLLPELDDEFAKDVSEFDTLAEYKEDLKKELLKRKASENEKAFKEEVMNKVIANMEGDIPDAMVDDRVDITVRNYESNLASQGLNLQTYMSIMGGTVEDFKKQVRPSCERQVKIDVALEKIADMEKFDITDEEVEEEYKNISERYSMDIENVKKNLDAGAVKSQLVLDKAEELIYSTAVAEEPAKEEKEEAAEKPKKKATAKKAAPKKKAAAKDAEKAEEKAEEKSEETEKAE